MRVFLAGVACVGKTTVGARLADLLGCLFFDLDLEVERFYETSIERLQSRYLTSHSFRLASQHRKHAEGILGRPDVGVYRCCYHHYSTPRDFYQNRHGDHRTPRRLVVSQTRAHAVALSRQAAAPGTARRFLQLDGFDHQPSGRGAKRTPVHAQPGCDRAASLTQFSSQTWMRLPRL
jgi:Shikimate kinase